jgi:hypothetical protein
MSLWGKFESELSYCNPIIISCLFVGISAACGKLAQLPYISEVSWWLVTMPLYAPIAYYELPPLVFGLITLPFTLIERKRARKEWEEYVVARKLENQRILKEYEEYERNIQKEYDEIEGNRKKVMINE